MILVTRLNGSQFYINAEMIQLVENTPDTVITLTDKSKLVVQEPAEVVVQRFIEYRQKINQKNGLQSGDIPESKAEKE